MNHRSVTASIGNFSREYKYFSISEEKKMKIGMAINTGTRKHAAWRTRAAMINDCCVLFRAQRPKEVQANEISGQISASSLMSSKEDGKGSCSGLPTYLGLVKTPCWKIALRDTRSSSVAAETPPGSNAGVVTPSLEGTFTERR